MNLRGFECGACSYIIRSCGNDCGFSGKFTLLTSWNAANETIFNATVINNKNFNIVTIEANIIDILLKMQAKHSKLVKIGEHEIYKPNCSFLLTFISSITSIGGFCGIGLPHLTTSSLSDTNRSVSMEEKDAIFQFTIVR